MNQTYCKESPPTNILALHNNCSSCSLHTLCLPTGLTEVDMQRLDTIIARRKIPRDSHLYRGGDAFNSLYAVRVGHFKTYRTNVNGDRQVIGFQMKGELLGMDAIGTDKHQCNAIALEDSEICEIPFSQLEKLFSEIPTLLRHYHRIMSQEITREQSIIVLLGNMRAEQRMAAFLVNLASRYQARGYSGSRFLLRMTREDIGNYLGLTTESISRLITKLKKDGLLKVNNREVEVPNIETLKNLAVGSDNNNFSHTEMHA